MFFICSNMKHRGGGGTGRADEKMVFAKRTQFLADFREKPAEKEAN